MRAAMRERGKIMRRPGEWKLGERKRGKRRAGLTLIELIVAFSILMILSTIALPLVRVKVQREKEHLLRLRLSEIRSTIDRYKDMADQGRLAEIDPKNHGYPESLEILVEGVPFSPVGGAGLGGPGGMNQPGAFGPGQGAFGNRRGATGGNRSGGAFGGGGSRGGGGFGGGFGGSQRGIGGSQSGFGSSRGGFGASRSGSRSSGMGSGMGMGEEEQKIRFLRRIPVDPMSGLADWGLRDMQDDPDATNWGGNNVFDVYSKSMDTALDGTYYRDW